MLGRGGAAPWVVCCSPPLTPLFIGEGARGAGPSRWDLEGAAPREGGLAPQAKGAPPLGFPLPNPRRMGPRGGAPSPLGAGYYPYAAQVAPREGWSLPVDPRNLSGGPGTIPV